MMDIDIDTPCGKAIIVPCNPPYEDFLGVACACKRFVCHVQLPVTPQKIKHVKMLFVHQHEQAEIRASMRPVRLSCGEAIVVPNRKEKGFVKVRCACGKVRASLVYPSPNRHLADERVVNLERSMQREHDRAEVPAHD